MEEKVLLKCTNCGEPLKNEVGEGKYKCKYCGFINYIPTTNKYNHSLEDAQRELKSYNFSKADEKYKAIIQDSDDVKIKAMCLWGRLLAKFGVVFVRSFDRNYFVPTFSKYNPDYNSITESDHYKELMKLNLDKETKQEYIEKSEELDKHYKQITTDLKSTPEYDIFLCTKISNTTEAHPELQGYAIDKDIAENLYEELKKEGLKVFYSEKCVGGVHFDSQIYSALTKSKVILVLSTSKEYLESAWVQSEWRRWLNFINVKVKKENSFFLYLPEYSKNKFDLPTILEEERVQYFISSKKKLMFEKIFEIVNLYSKKSPLNKGAQRISIEQSKIIPLKPSEIGTIGPRKVGVSKSKNVEDNSIRQLLNQAKSRLKIGRYDDALKSFEAVLKEDLNSGEALKGKFLCSKRLNDFSGLVGLKLYESFNDIQEVISNIDSDSAYELLEQIKNNFLMSINNESLSINKIIELFNGLASFDFDGRKELIVYFEEKALTTQNHHLLDAVSKHKDFKKAEELINYFKKIGETYPNLNDYCYTKILEVDPGNKEALKHLALTQLLEISNLCFENKSTIDFDSYPDSVKKIFANSEVSVTETKKSNIDEKLVNKVINKLDYFQNDYFVKYLSYCAQNNKEKNSFISEMLETLEKFKILKIPSVLLWAYQKMFLYYSEDYDFRKHLYKLITDLNYYEFDYSNIISLYELANKEFSNVLDLESSKYLIDVSCRAICNLYKVKTLTCYEKNDFELFKKNLKKEVFSLIKKEQLDNFISDGIAAYERNYDSFEDNLKITNCYAFLSNFNDNIAILEEEAKTSIEQLKEYKKKTLNDLVAKYPSSNYINNELNLLVEYQKEVSEKIAKALSKNEVDQLANSFVSKVTKLTPKNFYDNLKKEIASAINIVNTKFPISNYIGDDLKKLKEYINEAINSLRNLKAPADISKILSGFEEKASKLTSKKHYQGLKKEKDIIVSYIAKYGKKNKLLAKDKKSLNDYKKDYIRYVKAGQTINAINDYKNSFTNLADNLIKNSLNSKASIKNEKISQRVGKKRKIFLACLIGLLVCLGMVLINTLFNLPEIIQKIINYIPIGGLVISLVSSLVDVSFECSDDYTITNRLQVLNNFLGSICLIPLLSFEITFLEYHLSLWYLVLQVLLFVITIFKRRYFNFAALLAIFIPLIDIFVQFISPLINLNPNITCLIVLGIIVVITLFIGVFAWKNNERTNIFRLISYTLIFMLISSIINGHFFDFKSFDILYWVRFDILGLAVIIEYATFVKHDYEFQPRGLLSKVYALYGIRILIQAVFIIGSMTFANDAFLMTIINNFVANGLNLYVYYIYSLIPIAITFGGFLINRKYGKKRYKDPNGDIATFIYTVLTVVALAFTLLLALKFLGSWIGVSRVEGFGSNLDNIIITDYLGETSGCTTYGYGCGLITYFLNVISLLGIGLGYLAIAGYFLYDMYDHY